MHVRAIPLKAGGVVVGGLSVCHGVPPTDATHLEAISGLLRTPLDELKAASESSQVPPANLRELDDALRMSAELFGRMVERSREAL